MKKTNIFILFLNNFKDIVISIINNCSIFDSQTSNLLVLRLLFLLIFDLNLQDNDIFLELVNNTNNLNLFHKIDIINF